MAFQCTLDCRLDHCLLRSLFECTLLLFPSVPVENASLVKIFVLVFTIFNLPSDEPPMASALMFAFTPLVPPVSVGLGARCQQENCQSEQNDPGFHPCLVKTESLQPYIHLQYTRVGVLYSILDRDLLVLSQVLFEYHSYA